MILNGIIKDQVGLKYIDFWFTDFESKKIEICLNSFCHSVAPILWKRHLVNNNFLKSKTLRICFAMRVLDYNPKYS